MHLVWGQQTWQKCELEQPVTSKNIPFVLPQVLMLVTSVILEAPLAAWLDHIAFEGEHTWLQNILEGDCNTVECRIRLPLLALSYCVSQPPQHPNFVEFPRRPAAH
eukprot:5206249-Amphidinium_carterae.1